MILTLGIIFGILTVISLIIGFSIRDQGMKFVV